MGTLPDPGFSTCSHSGLSSLICHNSRDWIPELQRTVLSSLSNQGTKMLSLGGTTTGLRPEPAGAAHLGPDLGVHRSCRNTFSGRGT